MRPLFDAPSCFRIKTAFVNESFPTDQLCNDRNRWTSEGTKSVEYRDASELPTLTLLDFFWAEYDTSFATIKDHPSSITPAAQWSAPLLFSRPGRVFKRRHSDKQADHLFSKPSRMFNCMRVMTNQSLNYAQALGHLTELAEQFIRRRNRKADKAYSTYDWPVHLKQQNYSTK